jgi:AcrR family transcriptional regulator
VDRAGLAHTVSTTSTTTTDRPRRRTQAERTAETRAKLLDATIDCIAEIGYAATTGREVAMRAGVSRGAQTHHFPRRMDLIVSALDEIGQRQLRIWSAGLEGLPPGRARVRRALDTLWEELRSPLWVAATKMWIAADDDPELYDRMIRPEADVAIGFRQHAKELFGDYIHEKGFDSRLNVALSAMRGLALVMAFEPIGHERKNPWPAQRRELEKLLLG